MKLLIKLYRKRRRMTLEQLSMITGISKSYLSEIEHNNSNITLDKLVAISCALEVCPKVLIQCNRSINCDSCSYCKKCCNKEYHE